VIVTQKRKRIKDYVEPVNKTLLFFLNDFFNLEVIPGKKARVPYWRNRFSHKKLRRIQGPFGGKGTPSQIRRATLRKAEQTGVDLRKLTPAQIRAFMRQKRIGLDCSGFAFQILNFLRPGFWAGLRKAPGTSNNPIIRFSAKALTSKENTIAVEKTVNIRPGDMIPMSFFGKGIDHLLVVVENNGREIVYAHSSSRTTNNGPHLGKIKITNPKLKIKSQKWLEKTKNGNDLSRYMVGDDLRRVKK